MLVDPMWTTAVTIARIPRTRIAAASSSVAPRSLEARVYHHRMGLDSSVAGSIVGSVADPVAGFSTSAAAAAPLSFVLR